MKPEESTSATNPDDWTDRPDAAALERLRRGYAECGVEWPGDEEIRARGREWEKAMAQWVAEHGAPTLEHYRRAYAGCGAEWPGDEEIRARHHVAP